MWPSAPQQAFLFAYLELAGTPGRAPCDIGKLRPVRGNGLSLFLELLNIGKDRRYNLMPCIFFVVVVSKS